MTLSTLTYPIRFKAAILEESHCPLVIRDVSFSGPLEVGQVVVQVLYSGICGKQLEEIDATMGPDLFLPHMLGHEGSGVVLDIGPGVRKVVPGDKVVLHWLKGSGIDAITPLYMMGDQRVNAGWVTTFNEIAVVSENRITPVPASTDMSTACLLGCAVTTGVGVVLNELNLKPGQSVAVFGCGGIGLNAVQGAVIAGCDPIIGVDPAPANRALAVQLGATNLVDPGICNPILEVKRLTQGRGAQAVVVAVGSAAAVEVAVECSSIPGTVILAGVPPSTPIRVDPFAIHCRRTLTGSYGGGTYPDRDIPAYLGLYAHGRLKLKELIFGEFSLEDVNQGIEALRSGQPGRCVIRMAK